MDENFLVNIENACPNIYNFLCTSHNNNLGEVLRCLAVIKAYSENWLDNWEIVDPQSADPVMVGLLGNIKTETPLLMNHLAVMSEADCRKLLG